MRDDIVSGLLKQISDIEVIPSDGAYNIRRNGEGVERRSTKDVEITTKTDKPGIDIRIAPFSKADKVSPNLIIATNAEDIAQGKLSFGVDFKGRQGSYTCCNNRIRCK